MKSLIVAFVAVVAATLGGCQSMSSVDWGRVSTALGILASEAGADPKIAQAAEKLRKYCPLLQALAVGASAVTPERQQVIAQQAAAAVSTACLAPTAQNAEELARIAADSYAAIQKVRQGGV